MSRIRHALVFGASGQIGACLLADLTAAGWRVSAVSRRPQPARPGVCWLRGDCASVAGLPRSADAVFSCGPLDAFADWFASAEVDSVRVVAFGSTSVEVKADSIDPDERELAQRLRRAEHRLFARAAMRGQALTVLRPTLVYGVGRDRNLTRIAQLARRLHGFALPSDALGLRQPVHVQDLAAAAHACVDAVASHGRAYATPGGETLPYREMVARVLAALRPRPRLWSLPPPVFRALLAAARPLGVAGDFNDAALARMRRDLVFDATPAARDFGYAPRRFAPLPAAFAPPVV